MPSVYKSTLWFVRVDGAHDWLREKIKCVLAWVDLVRILGVLHEGEKKDNLHCHFVVEMSSELQKQSFDMRIKKIFDVKGSAYSSKPWDGGESACAYMFHESDDGFRILCNKGFTEDAIERFKELNRATQKVIEVNKQKASGRVVDRVLAEVTPDWTKRDIAMRILKMIREGDVYEPGDFMLKRYIEEIYSKSRTNEQFAEYADDRIYRLLV